MTTAPEEASAPLKAAPAHPAPPRPAVAGGHPAPSLLVMPGTRSGTDGESGKYNPAEHLDVAGPSFAYDMPTIKFPKQNYPYYTVQLSMTAKLVVRSQKEVGLIEFSKDGFVINGEALSDPTVGRVLGNWKVEFDREKLAATLELPSTRLAGKDQDSIELTTAVGPDGPVLRG